MKILYTLAFCTILFTQLAYSQQPDQSTPQNPNPTPPTPLPVLLQTGGLPGIGTTLNQDYNSVGINPANLGMVTTGLPVITFGFLGLSGGIQSNAVGLSTIEQFFTDSLPYQKALSSGFADHGASVSLHIMDFGASVQIPKIGGFAFTVQDNIMLNVYMNPTFANIVFYGYNSSYFNYKIPNDTGSGYTGIATNPKTVQQAFDGSYVKGSYTRSYALSYGRDLFNFDNNNLALYVGGSLEYVAGFGFADGYTTSNGISAFLAYSTTFSSIGDSNSKISPAHVALFGPSPAGHGEGLDLGTTLVIKKDIRVSLSVTDVSLGDMTWSGVTYQVLNSFVDSLKNYKDAGSLFKSGLKSSLIFVHPATFMEPLPTQFHLGGSIFLMNHFVVAADIDVPLNSVGGNLEQPVSTLSGGYCIGGFRVTLGFQNSAYAPITVPLGIIIGTGKKAVWQWGISYEDALNFLRTNSIATGGSFFFLRFRV